MQIPIEVPIQKEFPFLLIFIAGIFKAVMIIFALSSGEFKSCKEFVWPFLYTCALFLLYVFSAFSVLLALYVLAGFIGLMLASCLFPFMKIYQGRT